MARLGRYLGSVNILRPKRAGLPQIKTVFQKGENQAVDVWRNIGALPRKSTPQTNGRTQTRPIQNAIAKPDRRLTPYKRSAVPPGTGQSVSPNRPHSTLRHKNNPRHNDYGQGGMSSAYRSSGNEADRQRALEKRFTAGQVQSYGEVKPEQVAWKSKANPYETIVVSNTGFNTKQAQTLREVKNEVLRIKAVWPFDFFPDELIIEEKRIVVNRRHFFLFNTIDTIPISNIFVFEVTHALFFSSIYIKGGEFGGIEVEIKWLKLKDAKRAKQIVDGLYMREKGLIEVKERDPKRRMEIIKKIGEAYTTS